MFRNLFVSILGILLVGSLFALPATGRDYPTKTIEILCPYAPGSSMDIVARLVADLGPKYLGQPMVVVNKLGAGGSVAAAEIISSKPDGYKLTMLANIFFATTVNRTRRRDAANLAAGYDVADDGTLDAADAAREHAGRGYRMPNGGLYTTVKDLARFVSFELGHGPDTVLSRSVLANNMSRTNSSVLDLKAGYGIGFMVNRRGGLVIYGHGGSVAGYLASAQFDRASGTGVVVLRNVNGGKFEVGPLADRLLEVVAAAAKTSGYPDPQ